MPTYFEILRYLITVEGLSCEDAYAQAGLIFELERKLFNSGRNKMKTTLNKLSNHKPCTPSWDEGLQYLGKTEPDDEPIDILDILEVLGLDDALWSLRAVDGYDREFRLFACWCAAKSLPVFEKEHPDDNRPKNAIKTAIRFANGKATKEELATTWDTTWDTARNATWDTTWDATWDAAWAAAWDAAILSRVHICTGLKLAKKHIDHANARWDVWKRGYGLCCDVDGVLFVYRKP